jgi:hypothetical protein
MQKALLDAKYKLNKLDDAIKILDILLSNNTNDWTLYLKRAMYTLVSNQKALEENPGVARDIKKFDELVL